MIQHLEWFVTLFWCGFNNMTIGCSLILAFAAYCEFGFKTLYPPLCCQPQQRIIKLKYCLEVFLIPLHLRCILGVCVCHFLWNKIKKGHKWLVHNLWGTSGRCVLSSVMLSLTGPFFSQASRQDKNLWPSLFKLFFEGLAVS